MLLQLTSNSKNRSNTVYAHLQVLYLSSSKLLGIVSEEVIWTLIWINANIENWIRDQSSGTYQVHHVAIVNTLVEIVVLAQVGEELSSLAIRR